MRCSSFKDLIAKGETRAIIKIVFYRYDRTNTEEMVTSVTRKIDLKKAISSSVYVQKSGDSKIQKLNMTQFSSFLKNELNISPDLFSNMILRQNDVSLSGKSSLELLRVVETSVGLGGMKGLIEEKEGERKRLEEELKDTSTLHTSITTQLDQISPQWEEVVGRVRLEVEGRVLGVVERMGEEMNLEEEREEAKREVRSQLSLSLII